jgi:transposase
MPIMGAMAKRKPARARRSFSPEFKADVVKLVLEQGRTAGEVSRDLDLTETAVREWVKQAQVDAGDKAGLTSDEKAELAQLRKEVRVLPEERDLLKRATAFFAKETR